MVFVQRIYLSVQPVASASYMRPVSLYFTGKTRQIARQRSAPYFLINIPGYERNPSLLYRLCKGSRLVEALYSHIPFCACVLHYTELSEYACVPFLDFIVKVIRIRGGVISPGEQPRRPIGVL